MKFLKWNQNPHHLIEYKVIRPFAFYSLLIPLTMLFSITGLIFLVTPLKVRYGFVTRWSHCFIFLAKVCLGLRYQVVGLENLPHQPCVVVANHQSYWETIFMQVLLPTQSWVLKRELLRIPFFGWGLALLNPIAINRKNRNSIKDLLEQGQQRLQSGRWVVIYPEGTRLPVDEIKTFSRSAAALAIAAKVPMVPVAHNAGLFWPRGPWTEQSGVIELRIGPPIPSEGKTAHELTDAAEQWILAQREQMPPQCSSQI